MPYESATWRAWHTALVLSLVPMGTLVGPAQCPYCWLTDAPGRY